MSNTFLRWLAVVLLLATALIHISIGFSSGFPVFYVMGIIYLVGVGSLAVNMRPRLFQPLALVYTVILLVIWAAVGFRDVIAYVDKVLEVILVVDLIVLIRRKPAETPVPSNPS